MADKKKVLLNDFEATVVATIRSRQPGIVIQSLEEQRGETLWEADNSPIE